MIPRSLLAPLALLLAAAAPAAAQMKDKNGKVITEDDKKEYMKDFNDFDSDGNGSLDAQEVLANFRGEVDPRELWDFFRMADVAPQDGKVGKEEYTRYAADLSAGGDDEGKTEV